MAAPVAYRQTFAVAHARASSHRLLWTRAQGCQLCTLTAPRVVHPRHLPSPRGLRRTSSWEEWSLGVRARCPSSHRRRHRILCSAAPRQAVSRCQTAALPIRRAVPRVGVVRRRHPNWPRGATARQLEAAVALVATRAATESTSMMRTMSAPGGTRLSSAVLPYAGKAGLVLRLLVMCTPRHHLTHMIVLLQGYCAGKPPPANRSQHLLPNPRLARPSLPGCALSMAQQRPTPSRASVLSTR